MKTVSKIAATISMAIVAYMITMGVKAAQLEKKQQEYAQLIEQIDCLALNIYFESRNQSIIGMQAVAWVTLNRVNHELYPNNICDVVWDSKQFSWTHDGKSDQPTEREKWVEARQIAFYVMENHTQQLDPTEGAIMFHANYVKPWWARHYERTVRIDNHIFYKEAKL
jgi:spore germination cell wall hydrolase CwlJ-like protein